MIGQLLLVFTIIAFILSLVFVCLCVSSALGVLGFLTSFLNRRYKSSHDRLYSGDTEPINMDCFICLERVSNEVVATCNHSFCGECIASYIQSNANATINCPACRKEILILFRRFEPHTPEQMRIKQFISSYNYKFTKEPSILRAISEFGNTLRNIPILFSLNGLSYLLADSRLKYVLLLAVYTISPFDFLPEAILGPVGLLDDGIAMAGMIRQISSILYGFVREEENRRDQ